MIITVLEIIPSKFVLSNVYALTIYNFSWYKILYHSSESAKKECLVCMQR